MAAAAIIKFSQLYRDDLYEYMHAVLPQSMAQHVKKSHLMSEVEWRSLGINLEPGWELYMQHPPEPHVLLFRRPRADGPATSTQQTGHETSDEFDAAKDAKEAQQRNVSE